MSQTELDRKRDQTEREIQAIKDVLNYRVAVKKAVEKGLPPPVFNLDVNFMMNEEMNQEQLQRQLEQLQEKENLLLRGNFLLVLGGFNINFSLSFSSPTGSTTLNW